MTAGWLPQEDIDRLNEMMTKWRPEVEEVATALQTGRTDLDWSWWFDTCYRAAVATWLLEQDVAETKRLFQLAGEAGLRMFGQWGRGSAHTADAEDAVEVMHYALISGDKDLARRVAEQARIPSKYRVGHPTVKCSAGALKDVILGNESQAKKHLQSLAASTRKQPYQQMGELYSALLAGDVPAIEKGLKAHVKWAMSKVKPVRQEYWVYGQHQIDNLIPQEYKMSIPGLAFCNFAASRGIKVDIDAPILPKELQG